MAKGKHSVALFEVIQAGRATRSGGGSLATPKWWFKRRNAADTAAAEKTAATIAALPAPATVPTVFEPQYIDTAPPAANPSAARPTAVDLKVDPDRQRISFHFTYTSAIIVAFSVIVVVSLAYIIGNHVNQGPTEALAGPSVDEIRSGPVQAAVMNVSNSAPVSNAASKKPAPVIEREEATTAMPFPIAKNASQTGTLAPTVSPSGQRVSGLNYIIVQSWPAEEQQMAIEACEALNKSGIACTVEQDVKGYLKFAVVTQTGFARISSAEYIATEKSIREMSDKFAKTSKFKKFSPTAKKW